jgi:hypothetical protein
MIPRMHWLDFLKSFKWEQGEHVTLIGPTGQGKTYLVNAIIHLRRYVAILITKKRDPMIKEFEKQGFERLKSWQEVPHEIHPKVLLQPPFARNEPKERHQFDEFKYALDRGFEQGKWTLYADELPYLIDELGLKKQLQRLWYQGRSLKVSVISSAQRPAWLPLLAYSSATHLFFFRTTDETDLKRLGGLGGVDNKVIRAAVSVLGSHEVLYLNTRTGKMLITKVS